ncbi:MAG TPA: diguanylate cyclase [Pyrinomonadaceae bacterium]|nr:diguanylate cyclase [Pyrinomonadaceae bacterium]
MNARVQREKSVERPARQSRRVLLITDDSDDSLRPLLESIGVEIVGVCAGAAALISLQRSRPQLVIARTATKAISTQELARMLGQSHDGTPLILVGAEAATLERRQAALAAGAFDYFQIPGEFELLIPRARQLIKVRQTIERLRGEADLDHLTGLANRRRFRVALTGEVERWRRYGVPCALLLLDIDHMKAINDNFGHPVGDVVIREIAATLTKVSRDNDTAARLGGEEFALLLAGIDGTKAEFAARRLLDALAEQQVEGVGSISVSIGVASCPDHANSERALYAASDQALYVAKNEGRKRVAVAPLIQERVRGA